MKAFRFLLLIFIVSLTFISCNDDGYSLGDFSVEMATINNIDETTYSLTLDDGTKLWIASPLNPVRPSTKRAIINYTILSDKQGEYDHYIKLNGIRPLLTKDVIYIDPEDTAKQDSIGSDPIKILSVWEGGGYINIYFGFNTGDMYQHMVNILSDKADLGVTDEPVKLQFRHNKNGDPENYGAKGYVSFDLTPYKNAAEIAGKDKISFEITAIDFDGTPKTYKLEYKTK